MKKFIDSNRYKEDFFFNLPGPYKLLWDYINCDCEHNGVWTANFQIAQIMIGVDMPVNKATALELFNDGVGRVVILNNGKQWFLPSYVYFQHGWPIKPNRATEKTIAFIKTSGLTSIMDSFVSAQNSGGENFDLSDPPPRPDQDADFEVTNENKPLGSPLEGGKVKVEVKVEDKVKVEVQGIGAKSPKNYTPEEALECFTRSYPEYIESPDDKKAMQYILTYLGNIQQGGNVSDVWEYVVKNMPKFYRDKSLKVVSNNIQSIANQLKAKNQKNGLTEIPTNLREYLGQHGL